MSAHSTTNRCPQCGGSGVALEVANVMIATPVGRSPAQVATPYRCPTCWGHGTATSKQYRNVRTKNEEKAQSDLWNHIIQNYQQNRNR